MADDLVRGNCDFKRLDRAIREHKIEVTSLFASEVAADSASAESMGYRSGRTRFDVGAVAHSAPASRSLRSRSRSTIALVR
jgi:hypothetical protein